jgi:hypothetical protein
MRPTAAAAFPAWLACYEGDCRDPYLDVRALPTVGLAFLCPLSVALTLAWTKPSGELATPADVHAGYASLCKLPPGMGGGWYRGRAGLTLTPSSYAALYAAKLALFESQLRSPAHVGPAWDSLPAVCQIARMRTAWADGGESAWPHLDAALGCSDWMTAAAQSQPSDMATQPAAYRASYRAVAELYRLAVSYPDDDLPDALPDGALASA